MIITTSISKLKSVNADIKIVITRKKINIEGVYYYSELSPNWELLKEYKDKKIDDITFAKRLFIQLKNDEIAMNILRSIKETDSQGATICLACYCGDSNKCHRTLIARLLEMYGCTYGGEK